MTSPSPIDQKDFFCRVIGRLYMPLPLRCTFFIWLMYCTTDLDAQRYYLFFFFTFFVLFFILSTLLDFVDPHLAFPPLPLTPITPYAHSAALKHVLHPGGKRAHIFGVRNLAALALSVYKGSGQSPTNVKELLRFLFLSLLLPSLISKSFLLL